MNAESQVLWTPLTLSRSALIRLGYSFKFIIIAFANLFWVAVALIGHWESAILGETFTREVKRVKYVDKYAEKP